MAAAGFAVGLAGCASEPTGGAATPPATSEPSPAQTEEAPLTSETPADPGATRTIVHDQDLVISETGPVTVHCDGGGDVTIVVSGITAELTGTCEDIEIDGSDNQVVFAATDDLDIDGSNNTASGDHADDITIEGHENVVEVQTVGEIEVEGNSNTVRFASGQPEIEDEGSGNAIGA